MTRSPSYKVFLSYNSEDGDLVEKIAVHLADKAKLRPWFDRWAMIPGESSIKQLERGFNASKACAVFVGASGEGPWQEKEVEALLRKQMEDPEFRVIPVLLPKALDKPDLPSFLVNNVWVDLQQGLPDDNALWLLECGIQGRSPGRGRPKAPEERESGSDAFLTQERFKLDVARADEPAHVFISYKHQEPDATLARIFAEHLKEAGHAVFIDSGIRWGADWTMAILTALEKADYLLVLLSKEAASSEMVQGEIIIARELALKREGFPIILPMRLCLPFSEHLPYQIIQYLHNIHQQSWENDDDTVRLIPLLLNAIEQKKPWVEEGPRATGEGAFKTDAPRPQCDPRGLIRPGGALKTDSRFYIQRDADEDLFQSVQIERALVTVRGPRQVGKTSMIMRTYASANTMDEPLQTAFVDFQMMPDEAFLNQNAIWCAIAEQIAYQLELDDWDESQWPTDGNYNRNISLFLKRFVFEATDAPLLLCLDEVDRIFSSSICNAFFGSVRAFYNQGAINATWIKIRWILGTSTEPSFFIEDWSQSPFNVGTQVDLNAFTKEQTANFARRHGLAPNPELLEWIMRYTGGKPYLTHLLFYHWVRKPDDLEKLFDAEIAGRAVFKNHLHRYLIHFQQEPDLAEPMRKIIDGKGCKDLKTAARLEAAGLITRDDDQTVVPACDLYADFFRQALRRI